MSTEHSYIDRTLVISRVMDEQRKCRRDADVAGYAALRRLLTRLEDLPLTVIADAPDAGSVTREIGGRD